MALRITIDGDSGSGKSAVGTLIEELLVSHGFMVMADINAPRTKEEASNAACSIAAHDPRVVLIEVQKPVSEMTRG
jgi:hypothetical protein